MKKTFLLFILAFCMFSYRSLADVSVSYGQNSDNVDYINSNRFPEIEEPFPLGPFSFRSVGNYIWIADGIGGKLLQYNKNNKFVNSYSICSNGTKPYSIDEYNCPVLDFRIDDFAPVFDGNGELVAWWLVDSLQNRLLNLSLANNEIREIKYPQFKQIYSIEVGKNGHLFVTDKVEKCIFILDSDGSFLSKIHWEVSGLAVSSSRQNDVLYRLMYIREEHKNMLVCTDISGKVIKTQLLDIENAMNSNLWWVDEEKGECVITYTPIKGEEGVYKVVRVGLDGKIRGEGQFAMPIAMNRFIDRDEFGNVYIGKCNFHEAPDGKFEIVPYEMP